MNSSCKMSHATFTLPLTWFFSLVQPIASHAVAMGLLICPEENVVINGNCMVADFNDIMIPNISTKFLELPVQGAIILSLLAVTVLLLRHTTPSPSPEPYLCRHNTISHTDRPRTSFRQIMHTWHGRELGIHALGGPPWPP